MAELTIKGILLALVVAAIFSYGGLFVLTDMESTYSVSISDNTTGNYVVIQEQSEQISSDMEQISEWLQDLTTGELTDFVFAMPTNVANILSLFVQIPNLMNTVFVATLAVFHIPVFVTQLFEVMMIIVILITIVYIWARA